MKIFMFFCAAALLIPYPVIAGPLEPPPDAYDDAGNPRPTMHTLEEIAHGWLYAPCKANMENRFVDNRDGTVTDCYTGLIWLKDANCLGTANWNDSMNIAAKLSSGQCGLNDGSSAGDWRLPTKDELEGIGTNPPKTWDVPGFPPVQWTKPGAPFIMQPFIYWSSTTPDSYPDKAWVVQTGVGYLGYGLKSDAWYMWPVRSGQ